MQKPFTDFKLVFPSYFVYFLDRSLLSVPRGSGKLVIVDKKTDKVLLCPPRKRETGCSCSIPLCLLSPREACPSESGEWESGRSVFRGLNSFFPIIGPILQKRIFSEPTKFM